LIIEPPDDAPRKLILQLTAVDDDGTTRTILIRLNLSAEVTPLAPIPGFIEQLKRAN